MTCELDSYGGRQMRDTATRSCSAASSGAARVDPTMTVLDWLRGALERRVGTKEGCAEGDCGACTVVVGRPDATADALPGGQRLHPVRGQLDGVSCSRSRTCRGPTGASSGAAGAGRLPWLAVRLLHARLRDVAVRAVETPEATTATRAQHERIDDALAGNLCRCTGYGPIVAAAPHARSSSRGTPDRFAAARRRHAGQAATRSGTTRRSRSAAAGGGSTRRRTADDARRRCCSSIRRPCIVAGAPTWVSG